MKVLYLILKILGNFILWLVILSMIMGENISMKAAGFLLASLLLAFYLLKDFFFKISICLLHCSINTFTCSKSSLTFLIEIESDWIEHLCKDCYEEYYKDEYNLVIDEDWESIDIKDI